MLANKQEILEEMAGNYAKILEAMDMPVIVSSLNGIVDNLSLMFDDGDSDPDFFSRTISKCQKITEGLHEKALEIFPL